MDILTAENRLVKIEWYNARLNERLAVKERTIELVALTEPSVIASRGKYF